MATVRGRAEISAFIASLPDQLKDKVLRGAARAGANVIAKEAKATVISKEVESAIKVATATEDGRIIGKVQVKGRGAYIAPWLEYGTDPHFVAVADSQRNGLSVRKVNEQTGDHEALKINGAFVTGTVFHPGARPHPFLRPALDIKEADALQAAQRYISTRITKAGVTGSDEGDAA